MEYDYIVWRTLQPLDSLNEGKDALRVDFSIHHVFEFVEGGKTLKDIETEPVLSGQVDWQGGVHLWQAEGIEPADFIKVMATAHAAIVEARTMIGSHWNNREMPVE